MCYCHCGGGRRWCPYLAEPVPIEELVRESREPAVLLPTVGRVWGVASLGAARLHVQRRAVVRQARLGVGRILMRDQNGSQKTEEWCHQRRAVDTPSTLVLQHMLASGCGWSLREGGRGRGVWGSACMYVRACVRARVFVCGGARVCFVCGGARGGRYTARWPPHAP